MIIEESLFSIPIYICSHADFYKRLDEKLLRAEAKHRESIAYKKYGLEHEPRIERNEWRFDKIIGWITLYLNGKTIKADYWLINAERIGLHPRNKTFERKGKIADVSATHNLDSTQILDDIRSFLGNCQQGKYVAKLKRYYIDTSEFYRLAEFMDMKALVENLNAV